MKFRSLMIFTSLVLLMSVASAALPLNGETELYDKLIRLHVIANSDSEEDQRLKLCVRDAALDCISARVSDCKSVEEAKIAIEECKDVLLSVCKAAISGQGYDCDVKIETGTEKYPEKSYGGFTLPSGDYYSLRIMIGEAAGRNWWCVLFPPLCVGAATEETAVMASAGLTKNEIDVITENEGKGYVVKFKIIEFLRGIFASK